jgi:hypothetical protein
MTTAIAAPHATCCALTWELGISRQSGEGGKGGEGQLLLSLFLSLFPCVCKEKRNGHLFFNEYSTFKG